MEDWKIHVRLPFEGIRIAGTLWSLPSHQVKDFLTRHQIPYQWLDIEKDSITRQLVEGLSSEVTKLPVVFFPDGKTLIQPDLRELADKVGLQTRAALPFYDQAKVIALLAKLPGLTDLERIEWDPVLMSILSACVLQERFRL